MPEIIAEAGEMVDPESPESIAAGIERVVFDSVHRSTLIQRGHQRVQAFSWQRSAVETLQVYRQVANLTESCSALT